MARNEEKQQGRLNRLWLQKEREEGRLKDAHERRPKLSTLNSASSVKKWIPSIKSEIEYYLQQSQLSHYPERKIAEFQQRVEALEREYKSFIARLRVLDPSCKHKPWSPRAYCKRRAEAPEPPGAVKNPRPCGSHDGGGQWSGGDKTQCHKASDGQANLSNLETSFQLPAPTSCGAADQDQPLSFDHTRLAVATAAFRGPTAQGGSCQTQKLARVLQCGLPNLVNASLKQTASNQSRDTENDDGARKCVVPDHQSDCAATERIPGKSSRSGTTEERTGHPLGLDCYSSSDEECQL